MKQKLLFSLIALCLSIGAWADALNVNDTFTADGITYKVTSTSPKEVQVGTGEYQSPAIDTSTTGALTIPASVTGTDGNTYSVTSIGNNAFRYCSKLTSTTIPSSVTSIGDYFIVGCTCLTTIVVEEGNTVYDSREGCNAVIKTETNELIAGCSNTTIPYGITSIGRGAFMDCSGLTAITIPNSVKTIGNDAFAVCQNLVSINIPNSVTSIGTTAFTICSSLTSITIPNSVTSISYGTFVGCKSLTSVTLPVTLKTISNEAFRNCESLTSITIPESASVGSKAFSGCTGLTEVRSMIKNPRWIDDNTFSNYDIPLYVPAGTKALYEATNGWKNFIPNIVEMEDEYNLCPDDHHPHMIDLGLPSGTKWACCNVDAGKPEDYGGYYAWGETEEKEVYDWSTYIYSDGSSTECYDIGSDIAGTQYDVAHVKWGGSWKMPTLVQMQELLDNCTYEWTTMNGINGGKFIGTNGNSVFIPAGGGAQDIYPDKDLEWTCGEFWASTFIDNTYYGRAYTLLFESGNSKITIWSSVCHGRSVRPVFTNYQDGSIPEEGLVAYYPFNGNANDESGNGNNGTIIGHVELAPDRFGNANSAYRFFGEPMNYISVPDDESLHLSTFTLSAWVYTDAEDYGSNVLINKGRDITNGNYHLSVNGVGAQNEYSGINGAGVSELPSTKVWHMVTGTVEGDQAKFYLDGVLAAEATLTHPFECNNTDPLTLGMHYYEGVPDFWAYPLLGVLDDVRIYNRVLSPSEIEALYHESNYGTETVTVGDALVAGFSSNKNLDFTSLEEQGVSAWIATGFRGGNVLLSRVYAVSAGEGVYVKAEKAGTYVIPTTTEAPFYMNMFVGVPDGKTVDMYEDFWGETYLTLSLAKSMSTGKPAFYPNTAPKTYGKNKMYLHMPARLLPEYATTRLNEFSLGIEFEDETTGISEEERLNDKGQMINGSTG